MTETRLALLSSLACLALVAWLALRGPDRTPATTAPVATASTELHRIEASLPQFLARLDALRPPAATANQVREPAFQNQSASNLEGKLDSLQRELQEMRLALQTVTDAVLANANGALSHNLAELQRTNRPTDWAACEALMQQAIAAPDAASRSYVDASKSTVLGALLMSRPIDVLNRFGSPSKTEIVQGRFVWQFSPPATSGENDDQHALTFTFEKGYVWDVDFTAH